MMWKRKIAQHLATLGLTAVLGGFLGASLVRIAPGYGMDEQELDARLSEESIRALRASRQQESNLPRFYARYLVGLFRGELGVSRSLGRPVKELLLQRVPVTLREVAIGLAVGWLLGITLALPSTLQRNPLYELASTVASGLFLCIPTAVLAFSFVLIGGAAPLAIGLVVFPKVFRYTRNLLHQTAALPHVLTAWAKGLPRWRILLWHVVPLAAPQMLSLGGVSVSLALGAAIPIEAICSIPGLGQLAWQAALGRDLPVLANLTLLVTLVTLAVNSIADLATTGLAGRHA